MFAPDASPSRGALPPAPPPVPRRSGARAVAIVAAAPPPPQGCGARAVAGLAVFSLHNAWNCWCFLNFTNFKPAEELLRVGNSEVGLITTAGWLG